MKKILITSLLFFGIISTFFGQGATVELGPKVRGIKHLFSTDIIGRDEDGIYVNQRAFSLFKGPNKYTRESYNLDMQRTNTVPFDAKKTNNRVKKNLVSTIIIKDKLFSLYSKKDLNNKINTQHDKYTHKNKIMYTYMLYLWNFETQGRKYYKNK